MRAVRDPAISLARRRRFDGVPPRGAQRKGERKDRRRGGCPLRDVALETTTESADRGREGTRAAAAALEDHEEVIASSTTTATKTYRSMTRSSLSDSNEINTTEETEKTEQATNLRRSASLFASSAQSFVVRRFVTPNTADGNEFLVFLITCTFVCLAFFARGNVQEKERLSRSSALLPLLPLQSRTANFLIAAATTDIQERQH